MRKMIILCKWFNLFIPRALGNFILIFIIAATIPVTTRSSYLEASSAFWRGWWMIWWFGVGDMPHWRHGDDCLKNDRNTSRGRIRMNWWCSPPPVTFTLDFCRKTCPDKGLVLSPFVPLPTFRHQQMVIWKMSLWNKMTSLPSTVWSSMGKCFI